ncbi:hypothetical protein U1Q18_017464 [Sarracenia purpurea var. burkii]
MLDGLENEDGAEEISGRQSGEKKRRLRLDQVKALEKIFEADNKLEAEQKAKVAEELGLQPRQVAIWFQNRRARWKTKRLERDFSLLQSDYDALKLDCEKLQREKEGLVAEVKELRGKLGEENTGSNNSVKEEAAMLLESEKNGSEQSKLSANLIFDRTDPIDPDYEISNFRNLVIRRKDRTGLKSGLLDSNCSGVFNEDSNPNAQVLMLPPSSSLGIECSSVCSPWMHCFKLSDPISGPGLPTKGDPDMGPGHSTKGDPYPHHFVKMEEQGLFSTEESGFNIFLVDQAPTLNW